MNLAEYSAKLAIIKENVSKDLTGVIIVPPANKLLAEIKQRVTRDGLNSNGGKIGDYSTKPIYASKNQFVRKSAFQAVGKRGTPTKKTMYLGGGYRQLRSIQGRPTDKVNLFYSGDMSLSYKMVQENRAVLLGIDNEKQALKVSGNEKRYGKFYHGTPKELDNYKKAVSESTLNLYTGIVK